MKKFNEVKEKHLKLLNQYVPIVTRVHGSSHPELLKVQEAYMKLTEAIKETKPLDENFNQLKEITNNYEIPNDVCETFIAVYEMLKELDQTYFLNR